ncbi:MAG: hypothetical protein FK734_05080 [Asgard group archaeon]|nr:hypothetical protein [Asgard group archaeon]
MTVLDEINQITSRSEKITKIPSDIDSLFYKVKGEGNEKKISFFTYNIVHRLAWSAIIWIIILLSLYGTYYYNMIYVGVIITVALLSIVFSPVRVWELNFKTNKIISRFKILGIPITKKEYEKKSFWNSKIEVTFYVFAYVGSTFENDTQQAVEMNKFYTSLLDMESDVNQAIKYSNFLFAHINFKLVQKAKEHEIEGSLPRGKFSFLNSRKIRKYVNPFEIIISNFFTKKRKIFIESFIEFFPLSEHFLDDKEGPKTYNKFFCSYGLTEKYSDTSIQWD